MDLHINPIESLTILRSIPNLLTIRPCDTKEVCGTYEIALEHNGPIANDIYTTDCFKYIK